MQRKNHYVVNTKDANGGPDEVREDKQHGSGPGIANPPTTSSNHDDVQKSPPALIVDSTMLLDKDTLCGFMCLKPACLQPFASMPLFTFMYGLSMLLTMGVIMYVITQITTLEKQLGISSADAGVLLAANDIGFLVTILFWSHFTRRGNKPLILGLAAMIFGSASILCSLPHFMLSSKHSPVIAADGSGGMSGVFGLLCGSEMMTIAINLTSRNDTSLSSGVVEYGTERENDSSGVYRSAYIMIAVGMALQGIVKAPRRPLAMTYIDDNVPKSKLGIHLGSVMGMFIFGPIIGSVLGATFSQMYVTLEETTMTLTDPRWIGAWWLGFMVLGATCIVTAIPLLFFPKRMPNAEIKNDKKPQHKDETAKRLLSDFPKAAFRLMKNPVYVLLILSEGIGMFAVSGATSFFPKYIEEHFMVPTWQAGIMMGACIAVGGCVGSVLSGILNSCLKLTLLGCMVSITCTDILATICILSALAVTCPQPAFHGLSSPSPAISHLAVEMLNWTCARGCTPGCSEAQFLPTCGADGLTYFSPCHAGCTGMLPNMTFTGCSCVSDVDVNTAMPGYCEGACDTLPGFLALLLMLVLISFMSSVPQSIMKLRCVNECDRDLALGFNGFFSSLLGFLLGPIVFGTVIDSTCVLWHGIPGSGEAGYCTLYDTSAFRVGLFTLMGGVVVGVSVLDLISLVIVLKMRRYKKIIKDQREWYVKAAQEVHQKKMENSGKRSSETTYIDEGVVVKDVKSSDVQVGDDVPMHNGSAMGDLQMESTEPNSAPEEMESVCNQTDRNQRVNNGSGSTEDNETGPL